MNAIYENILPSSSLFYSEGNSDKEYHAEVVSSGEGFLVNFRYGRRGASLTSGCKTPAPVDFDKAVKVFDKLVKEKMAKGYTTDTSGSAYQGTEKAGQKSDFVPQLCNAITEEEAIRLIADDAWAMQEKKDGHRRAAHATGEEATGFNRKGLTAPLVQVVADQLNARAKEVGTFRVDAESIGDNLYVFDLLIDYGESCKELGLGWLERMTLARQTVAGCPNVKALPVAVTAEEKRALFDKVKTANGEGVVFKRKDAKIVEGKPNSGGDWLKFKFKEHATVLVTGANAGKRSVSIALLDDINNKDPNDWKQVDVGNVTVPPSDRIPEKGELLEVEYLYAFKGGSIYQPVYQYIRDDVDADACVLSQLKFKPEEVDDEA